MGKYRGCAIAYTLREQLGGFYLGVGLKLQDIPAFPHGLAGVFISGSASIGRNCVIFQQVTIGSNTLIDAKDAGAPIIGDNCYIGAGAKIIGAVHIGDNCRIGANAVVYKDVPSNSTVVSGGMRIIPHEVAKDNRFYSKGIDGWGYWEDGSWKRATQDVEKLFQDKFEKHR